MIDRINLVLKAKNITARQFAEEIGIQPSGMSHIMSGRNKPSLEFVAKVIRRYPEIDANWLLMGRGEMYTSAPASRSVPPLPSAPVEPMLFPLDDPLPPEEVQVPTESESVDLFESSTDPVDEPVVAPVPYVPDNSVAPAVEPPVDRVAPVAELAADRVAPVVETAAPAADRVAPAVEAAADRVISAGSAVAEAVRLERIIFVYSDNTFRELHPSTSQHS